MNYREFRDLWHEAMRSAHLPIPYPIGPTEHIDMNTMSRSYEIYLYGRTQPSFEPFYPVAKVEWVWYAVLSARYETTEEDLLMQLYGDFGIHEDTVPPVLRMDVHLTAGVPYGTTYPLPALDFLNGWAKHASAKLQAILPTDFDDDGSILAYSSSVEPEIVLQENGTLGLKRVSFEAWQGIVLPRQWDHPDKRDPDP